MYEAEWLKKCLQCKHCYVKQDEGGEYRCRKRDGKCEFEPYVPKKRKESGNE